MKRLGKVGADAGLAAMRGALRREIRGAMLDARNPDRRAPRIPPRIVLQVRKEGSQLSASNH